MNDTAFQLRRRAGDATAPATKPKRRAPWLSRIRLATVRGLLAALLMGGVAVLAGNVFDRFRWELVVPVAIGAAAILIEARLPARLPPFARWSFVVALVMLTAIGVAGLSGGTLGDAIPGLADGPRRLLTTEWPSPGDPTVLATVGLLLGAATACAVGLARRPDLHLAPLVPIAISLVVVVALSAPRRPASWLLLTLGGLAVLFALSRHHNANERPAARVASLGGERALAVAVLAMIVASTGVAGVLSLSDRADPRRVAGPARSLSLLRPLESVVALRDVEPEFAVFTVVDESPLIGQEMPTRWRTAALDSYDGQRWVPQTVVRPIGERLGVESPATAARPVPVHYRIELLTDDTTLVPLPGRPLDLVSDPQIGIETDTERVAVKFSERAPGGTSLHLVAELVPNAGEIGPAVIETRQVDDLARVFSDTAAELAGRGDPLAQLQQLQQEMHRWNLDPDAAYGGQQLRMLEQFLLETHRGTAEQFATGFVLLARALGFDARVATGYEISDDRAVSPLTVRSSDAAAWPEVNISGVGWVAFDPLPENEAQDDALPEQQPDAQTPAAAQPPVEPPAEADEPDDTDQSTDDRSDRRWGTLTTWVVRAAVGISLIALPFALAIGAVLTIKYLRRRRRARAVDSGVRVRGAWANVTDALVDAGLSIESSWTDDRIAAMGSPLVGAAPYELQRLAGMSTSATFGPLASDQDSTDASAAEATIDSAIAESLTPWQRIQWRLSLRSLRRATRSPVDV